jgi:hypothetical protein
MKLRLRFINELLSSLWFEFEKKNDEQFSKF